MVIITVKLNVQLYVTMYYIMLLLWAKVINNNIIDMTMTTIRMASKINNK